MAATTDMPRPEHPKPAVHALSMDDSKRRLGLCVRRPAGIVTTLGKTALHNSRKRRVPYCFESQLSGIHDSSFHLVFWYRRSFAVPEIELWTGRATELSNGSNTITLRVYTRTSGSGSLSGLNLLAAIISSTCTQLQARIEQLCFTAGLITIRGALCVWVSI